MQRRGGLRSGTVLERHGPRPASPRSGVGRSDDALFRRFTVAGAEANGRMGVISPTRLSEQTEFASSWLDGKLSEEQEIVGRQIDLHLTRYRIGGFRRVRPIGGANGRFE